MSAASEDPLLYFRYRLVVQDSHGNVEGVLYANRWDELKEKLDELESRDRLNPSPVDEKHKKSAMRGAIAAKNYSR